ncbi:MAG TPA: hypothetical protein PK239_14395 [Chitinophagales bacterium]|nr:hypothetical protein [Chitinophagales bacterium]HRK28462.1 hypothetical protein [Chitinophagales bacterium]
MMLFLNTVLRYFYMVLVCLITLPALLQAQPCPVSGVNTTAETCAGQNNGSATILINSPGTYTYTWLPNVSTTNSASGLAPGNYAVTVTSGSGGPGGTPVTLFSDNFNGANTQWILNTGSGTNQWFIDNNYTGGACSFLGTPLFTVPNVPSQPVAITGAPFSNYLHVRATSTGGGLCSPPWPPLNANYEGGQTSTQCTEMTLPISTAGYGNVTLSFYWLCVGGSDSYGYVQYSTGGGWTSVGGNFGGTANWTQANLTNAAFDNQANIRYRFCWTNGSAGNDPAFSVDEVRITGQPLTPGCTSVVNFTIAPGAAVNASFNTLSSTYCTNDPDVILTPATGGGTFTGNGVAGNVFGPKDVTIFGTPLPITYTVTQNGCTVTTTQNVIVYATPNATFTPLNTTYLTTDAPIVLTPATSGGTFSGACIVSNVFLPSQATPGVPCTITYTIAQNGCTSTASQTVVVNPPAPSGTPAELRVLLQGAYDPPLGVMATNLLNANYLPLAQPFNQPPWNYPGSESVAGAGAFPPNTTDWVLVEARSAANPAVLLDRRAGFLLNSGVVVNTGGTQGITFGSLAAGSYYLVVRHRNHMAVMSSVPVTLPNTGNPYDFTTALAKAFGTNQMVQLGTNVWGLYAGDMNANGVITYADFNVYINQLQSGQFSFGYYKPDLNLDGSVTVFDFNLFRPNASVIGISLIRY